MTRDEYLDKCTKAAIKLGRFLRFRDVSWQSDDLVTYKGISYVPVRLIVSFGRNGRVKYSAEMQDIKSESVTVAKLEDIIDKNNILEVKT